MSSTLTTSGLRHTSLDLSSAKGLSLLERLRSCAPRNTSDPQSPTRMSLPLPLLKRSWLEYETSSQNLRRHQCPHVHYHPYCNKCRTLMEWEPPLPIRPTLKPSIMSFGMLTQKTRCRCLPEWRLKEERKMMKVCSKWRQEQFRHTVVKRGAQMAAWEAQRQQAHRQREDLGAAPLV